MNEIAYYVKRAQDEYGNTGDPLAIIKCEIIKKNHPAIGDDLKILAPPIMVKRIESCCGRFWKKLKGLDHEARMLEFDEWAILAEFKPNDPHN